MRLRVLQAALGYRYCHAVRASNDDWWARLGLHRLLGGLPVHESLTPVGFDPAGQHAYLVLKVAD